LKTGLKGERDGCAKAGEAGERNPGKVRFRIMKRSPFERIFTGIPFRILSRWFAKVIGFLLENLNSQRQGSFFSLGLAGPGSQGRSFFFSCRASVSRRLRTAEMKRLFLLRRTAIP
jgi:hypothetical protein